jgi:hypothetical protein
MPTHSMLSSKVTWKDIMDATNNGYPMVFGTNAYAPNYLNPLHGYSVLRGV